jgi:hypothetical protein
MTDGDEYGADGGIIIGRGTQAFGKKPTPLPLCPPQIPHDLCVRKLCLITAALFTITPSALTSSTARLSPYLNLNFSCNLANGVTTRTD